MCGRSLGTGLSVYVLVVYWQEKSTVLLVMLTECVFHDRPSSSESDTAEKKKKRGKEQLDGSERQKYVLLFTLCMKYNHICNI